MSQSQPLSQNAETTAFLARLATDGLDAALSPALEYEAELRRLFAQDRSNQRLADPQVGLVDVFSCEPDILATRSRDSSDDTEHIFALKASERRASGSPAFSTSLVEFQRNWSVFTEGALSQLDWSNVVAAGGAVQACLAPLPQGADDSRKALRKRFHESEAYAASDVDLFIYGLEQAQAENKIEEIFDAIRDAVPWDVTAVRTAHAISIHSQYPYRPIQIVLRLYKSPAEVLAGFDVDCCAVAYTPGKVMASPRALAAHIRQANLADPARRSPSYEVRLAKYAARGFEIHVPGLRRGDIDPQIFERSINRVQGLARLLVLEKLRDAPSRAGYIAMRAELRGRPGNNTSRYGLDNGGSHYKNDLKAKGAFADLDVELSGYDRGALRIPYGPGWHAARIEKLIWKTDMGMNSPFNPRNEKRRLHRHPAFFGIVQESMEDCCHACPAPENADEEKQQKDEDERGSYVRGRISFIKDDPGRQSMTGSFRPLDAHEWAAQTYVRAQERLLAAAAADDVSILKILIAQIEQQKQSNADTRVAVPEDAKAGDSGEEPLDLDARDCTGRTPLHVAILAGAHGTALELIEAGARMTPRLVGGRTSLHLAAQAGMDDVLRALLARSEQNRVEAEAKGADSEAERMSIDNMEGERKEGSDVESEEGEEGWEQVKSSDAHPSPVPSNSTDALEDPPADAPDVLELAAPDWDFCFSPLIYAILAGSLSSVTALLDAGAPVNKPTKNGLHPLAATIFTRDVAAAADIARALVAKGASSTVADENWLSILHLVVSTPGRADVLRALLESDPKGAGAACDAPAWESRHLVRPFGTAVATGNYAAMAVLAAFSAKIEMSEEDVSRAVDARKQRTWIGNAEDWRERVHRPLEAALARGEGVDGVEVLLGLGAKADAPPRAAIALGAEHDVGKKYASLADWASQAIKCVSAAIERKKMVLLENTPAPVRSADPSQATNWTEWRAAMIETVRSLRLPGNNTGGRKMLLFRGGSGNDSLEKRELPELERMREHYAALEALLRSQPGMPAAPVLEEKIEEPKKEKKDTNEYVEYRRLDGSVNAEAVPTHLRARYDQLFEAAWTGSDKNIRELCVTSDEPIQMAVVATNAHPHGDVWPGRHGYTPLTVAIKRKHWDTAKLILSITEAQHKKPDETKPYDANEGLSDDGSESDSMDVETGEDSEPQPLSFTDIAARPSPIQCRASPADLLDIEGAWPNGDQLATATALQHAMYADDIDAFKRILELYTHANADPASKWMTLDMILRQDRPEFLDVYIRATGAGLYPFSSKSRSTAGLPIVERDADGAGRTEANKETRVYFGLDWHGVKRADRRKTPPVQLALGAISDPLARQVAGYGSLKVLEYLSTSRPLAAYRAFIAAHPDKKNAHDIVKCASDAELPRAMRAWLGWCLNALDESVLLNAICADRLDVVRALFELEPDLMGDCLPARAKFSGLTPLLAAVRAGARPELFDHLLARGGNPADRDTRGWNVFHILTAVGERDKDKYEKYEILAKHLMQTLPQDLVLALLAQQSRGAQNTPLMLAVKKDRPSLVDLYTSLPLPNSVYLSRDASASTALHVTAQRAYASLARKLASVGPAELLHLENGVGQTADEVAGLRLLNKRAEAGSGSLPSVKWDLPVNQNELDNLKLPHLDQGLRGRVQDLRRELEVLLKTGKLDRTTDAGASLILFAEAMEARTSVASVSDMDATGWSASQDPIEDTYWVLFDAARVRPAKRGLVHVLDVQRSVEHNVRQAALEQEEEKARYTPYYERVRTIEEQLKDASIFKDGSMMYMQRRAIRGAGPVDWFAEMDEIY